MAAKKKTTKSKSQKKKRWFNVIAPPEFKSVLIGETPALTPEALVGRTFKLNMMTLTRDMKRQSFSVKFRVKEVKGNDAHTEFIKYEMGNVHVKRVVKRGRDKVDDSFVLETKDNIKVRLKPLMITKNKVQNSVKTALRKAVKEFIENELKEKTYSQLASSIIKSELQKQIRLGMKKIYPLTFVEFRVFQRL
jgi:small subunit ribosomal protein S3Ae